jgi:nucleoid-associated protein YgaU
MKQLNGIGVNMPQTKSILPIGSKLNVKARNQPSGVAPLCARAQHSSKTIGAPAQATTPPRPINLMAFKAAGRPPRNGLLFGRNAFRLGRSRIVRIGIPVIALLTVLGIGCATKKQAPAASALEVSPAPLYPVAAQPTAPYSVTPNYTTNYPAPQPAVGPEAYAAPQPSAPAPGAGSSYTVQKGDTLFKIARDRYGDGKQWTRIAAANPGISANSLRVGAKLVIP